MFFVLPEFALDFHLPTDLLGVTSGKYDNLRDDGNIKAALGPFCNQVRKKIKDFTYESLIDLENENKSIKKIAVDKDDCWEFFLSSELLKSRLDEINRNYSELEKGLIFQKSKSYNISEFCDWFSDSANDFIRLINIFKQAFEVELIKAYGEPGIAGNVYEIKSAIDKIASICKELLSWEYELQGIIAPDELKEVIELMKGWSKVIIDTINEFPERIEEAFSPENIAKGEDINLTLTFPLPPNSERIQLIIDNVRFNL